MPAIACPSLMGLCVLASDFALAACASVPGPAARADEPSPEITLVTLNLWHDKGDSPKRQRLIVETLRELRPDVIVLQEVFQHEGLPNPARTLAAALGSEYVFASVDAADGPKRFSNAILDRKRPRLQTSQSCAHRIPLSSYKKNYTITYHQRM